MSELYILFSNFIYCLLLFIYRERKSVEFNGQRVKEDLEKLEKLKGGSKYVFENIFSERQSERGRGERLQVKNLKLVLERVLITLEYSISVSPLQETKLRVNSVHLTLGPFSILLMEM